jgi:hypothetical protein
MSTKRIIIHIGFPRCASTLMQREIFPRLNGDIRVVSPASKDRRLIDFLNEHFILSGRNVEMTPVSAAEKSRVADIVAEYSESVVLISNEGLVGDSFDNMLPLPHLATAMRSLFGEPEILLIIRRQSDMVKSYYRYAIEEGCYKSFPIFLGYRNGRFAGFRLQRYAGVNINPAGLDFHNFINYLEVCFGVGNVHVLPFEWIKNDFRRFGARLSEMLGVKLAVIGGAPRVVNSGVHGADLFVLKALNRLWETRILGMPLLPRQPFFEFLDVKCRGGGLAMRLLRAASVRISPSGVFNVVSPVVSPLLNLVLSSFGITGLKSERAIEHAIDDAVFDSNVALNNKLGGILTGLGYCDRR